MTNGGKYHDIGGDIIARWPVDWDPAPFYDGPSISGCTPM